MTADLVVISVIVPTVCDWGNNWEPRVNISLQQPQATEQLIIFEKYCFK